MQGKQEKDFFFFSPAHTPMIILLAIIINKMYIGFGYKEEQTKVFIIKEEGLADY